MNKIMQSFSLTEEPLIGDASHTTTDGSHTTTDGSHSTGDVCLIHLQLPIELLHLE